MCGAKSTEWLLPLQGYNFDETWSPESRLFICIDLGNSWHTGPKVSEQGFDRAKAEYHKVAMIAPTMSERHLCFGGRQASRPMGVFEHPCIGVPPLRLGAWYVPLIAREAR